MANNKTRKELDELLDEGLISKKAKKTHLDSLDKLERETQKLGEQAIEKKQKNNEFLAKLPKGLVFEIGNFVIQT